MSFETVRLRLVNASQAHSALATLWTQIKPWVMDGHTLSLEVKAETRSTEQNRKFHALCSDVAKSGIEWAGKTRTAAEWKVLFVSGHSIATKDGAEMVPGLESEFVNLRESTATMSKARGSSLIEYTLAWCAMHDVRLPTYESEGT